MNTNGRFGEGRALRGGRLIWVVVLALAAGVPPAAQTPLGVDELDETLVRVGRRLEQWYSRAQTVVSRETVWIQPLRADLTPVDVPRRLAFELRVAWDPAQTGMAGAPRPSVLREALTMAGRASRDEPGCIDPKPVSPEPLGILLPARLGDTEFSLAGPGRVNGRPALLIDYQGKAQVPPDIQWTDACVSVMLHGRSRGRIWVDADSYDVLRMDDRLVGTFEFDVPHEYVRRGGPPRMVIERAESSIRYHRVQFEDPEESLMLPEAIDTVTVLRGRGMQRFRVSQRFSEYRRFLTETRLLY
jgi:hypothetical protein